MNTPSRRLAGAALLLAAWFPAACVPVPPPAPAVDSRGEPITTGEIRSVMHDSRQTGYAIGFGLLGGVIGTLVIGKIGYEIGYAHDIQQGCEDCGLSGLLTGALLGTVTGIVVGGNLGMHAGAHGDRDDAIARIIRDRARDAAPVGARRPAASSLLYGFAFVPVAPAGLTRP